MVPFARLPLPDGSSLPVGASMAGHGWAYYFRLGFRAADWVSPLPVMQAAWYIVVGRLARRGDKPGTLPGWRQFHPGTLRERWAIYPPNQSGELAARGGTRSAS